MVIGDRYELDDLPLGQGGMGAVYAGHDRHLDRRVAVKLLRLPSGPDQELVGDHELPAAAREVEPGGIFLAFSQPDYRINGFNGEFDDSTKYVPAAFEKGATACVVRPDRYEEHNSELEQFRHRIIFVDDVIAAFQLLAHGVYREWDRPVVAIKGSAGKTTAKELTEHVIESGGQKVLRNIKNYHTGIGHPLTVLKLAKDKTYDVAVLEMGMSTPMNEIARLFGAGQRAQYPAIGTGAAAR